VYVDQAGIDWSGPTTDPSYNIGQFHYILKEVKAKSSGTEMAISVGGWYDSNYFTSATSPANIDNTVESIKYYMDVLGFDNIDIDWEYPGFEHGCQQEYQDTSPCVGTPDDVQDCNPPGGKGTCKVDRSNDFTQYVALLKKIREKIPTNKAGNKPKITAAVPAGGKNIVKYTNLTAFCEQLDTLNIMTYDINGLFSNMTNHQSPIYDHTPWENEQTPYDPTRGTSVHSAVTAYKNGGCPANKITIGVPFYGRFLPGVGGSGPVPGGCTKHQTVATGDSCWSIGAAHGYTDTRLVELNPGLVCSTLQPGTSLCVSTSTVICSETYTVKSGDSCQAIADSEGLSLQQFQDLNPDSDILNNVIQAGFVLCVEGTIPPKSQKAKKSIKSTTYPGLYESFDNTPLSPDKAVAPYRIIKEWGITEYWDEDSQASYAYGDFQGQKVFYHI